MLSSGQSHSHSTRPCEPAGLELMLALGLLSQSHGQSTEPQEPRRSRADARPSIAQPKLSLIFLNFNPGHAMAYVHTHGFSPGQLPLALQPLLQGSQILPLFPDLSIIKDSHALEVAAKCSEIINLSQHGLLANCMSMPHNGICSHSDAYAPLASDHGTAFKLQHDWKDMTVSTICHQLHSCSSLVWATMT